MRPQKMVSTLTSETRIVSTRPPPSGDCSPQHESQWRESLQLLTVFRTLSREINRLKRYRRELNMWNHFDYFTDTLLVATFRPLPWTSTVTWGHSVISASTSLFHLQIATSLSSDSIHLVIGRKSTIVFLWHCKEEWWQSGVAHNERIV